MPFFTTIVRHEVLLGVDSYSVDSLARQISERLLSEGPKQNRTKIDYAIIWREDTAHRLCTVALWNNRGRCLDKAIIIGEEPMEAHQVRNIMGGQIIACKDCGGENFYYTDRSLFYEEWVCANCRKPTSTLTETGAST